MPGSLANRKGLILSFVPLAGAAAVGASWKRPGVHITGATRAARYRRAAMSAILVALASEVPATADEAVAVVEAHVPLAQQGPTIPGTQFQLKPEIIRHSIEQPSDAEDLLKALVSWIADNSDLPRVSTVPRIAFSPVSTIGMLRAAGLAGWQQGMVGRAPPAAFQSVISVYDRTTTTIHLPETWTGRTPEELSVLVHELVHFMQHAGSLKFECPQAQEEAAYAIQQKWLALFGHDLMKDFDLNPFTILVRTTCFN